MRTLDVRLAAIVLAVTAVFGIGVYVLHGYQVKRNAYVFEQQAEIALERASVAKKENNRSAERTAYGDAMRSLQWYVQLVPEDVDAVEKLGMLVADRASALQSSGTPDGRLFLRAFDLLERVTRNDPERKAARRRLVEIAMSQPMQRYPDAKEHLSEFLLKQDPTNPELWLLLGRCNAETGEFSEAEANFKQAIQLSPSEVEVYPLLAAVLRYRFGRNKEADEVMEKLVKENPKSARAHNLRGSYLKDINSIEEAVKEAQESLKLAPDNRDSLWLAAQCYIANRELDKARECATRGIKLYPDEIRMYLTMTDIEMRSGNRSKEAVDALQQGLKATTRSPQLLWALANLLIEVKDQKEAEKVIAELRTADYYTPLIDYLSARIEFSQGRWLRARQGFEKIRGALNRPELLSLFKQVEVWIGNCYGQLGNRDLEMDAYRRVLNRDPTYAPAKAAMMAAKMNSGDVEDMGEAINAIKQIQQQAGKASPIAQLSLVRMLVLQNLRKPVAQRNWTEAEKAVDEAEKLNADSAQTTKWRAEILVAKGQLAEAEALLLKARDKDPDQSVYWVALRGLAERQQDWAKAERLLAESQKRFGDTVDQRLSQAQLLVRQFGPKASDRLRKLAENIDSFSEAERLQLWNGLLGAAIQIADEQQTKKLCQLMVEKDPNNVQIRYLFFEQALRARDDAGIEKALDEIKNVAGQQNAYWLYGMAVRLVIQEKGQSGASPALTKALEYLAQARELSPSWSRLPLLMAGIYDQQNQSDLALKNYQEAIDLGDRNSNALRRTVQLLYEKQRYGEADRLLGQLEGQQVPFSFEICKASAEAALRTGDFDRALEMARKAAATQPKQYQEQIWLGQILALIGRRSKAEGQARKAAELLHDAEKAFRRAVELESNRPEPWVAIIQFFGAAGAVDQAEQAINDAKKNIPAKDAPLALAQCYEAMKKMDAAESMYQSALKASPQDSSVVRAVADFYCRTNKFEPAETQLRRMIDGKIKVGSADMIWARRQMALIYVSHGDYANLQKARDLIEDNLVTAKGSVVDRRVRAVIDASDPARSRRNEAMHALESLIQEESATADDRFRLAQMYLNAGEWAKASAQLRNLVGSNGSEPQYYTAYIGALLQHGETSNAEVYIGRLENLLPNHVVSVCLRAELLVAKDAPDQALQLLQQVIEDPNARPPERKVRVRYVAEVLEKLAKKMTKPAQKAMAQRYVREAESLLRAFVRESSDKEWLLVAFWARQGQIDEALDLLAKASENTDAATLSVTCALFTQYDKISKQQLARLDGILETALKRAGRAVPLLMTMAEVKTKEGLYADAENCYREVIQKNPGNAHALNNLALLQALQGIELDASLKLVNKAIEISGPMGAMLDSRASIYMALGQPDKALADMTVALADAETPVRFFHQAQAYEMAGQHDAAVTMMERAIKKGLTKAMVHPLEAHTFEKLRQSLPQTPDGP